MTTTTEIAVGTELPPLRIEPISRATLALFAGASGDHMPIHIDSDAAKKFGYDDVFAQGMLSMAYLGRLLTDWVPQHKIRSYRVRFTAVTPLYAEPTCTGRVTDITDGVATLELTVTLADGTETLRGDATVDIS